MKKMTQEKSSPLKKKLDLDSEQLEALLKENQSYKTLLSMQNESYYRAEILESIMILQSLLSKLDTTIDERLNDLNKILIGIAKKK